MQGSRLLCRLRHLLDTVPMLLVAAGAAAVPLRALAQGGPPLVTDDPDTAPTGHWEINLAAIGSQMPGFRQLTLPDADINYGWADHVQLKLDTPWLLTRSEDAPLRSGLGASQLGVKWRFIDTQVAGFSMSTYPQVLLNLLPSSYRRGLTEPGSIWFLPLEASTELAGFGLDAEVGRYLSTSPVARTELPDAWAVGFAASHGCALQVQCLLELRESLAPADRQTLLQLGGTRELNDALALLFAVGHDFGPRSPDHEELLFYLGLQVRH